MRFFDKLFGRNTEKPIASQVDMAKILFIDRDTDFEGWQSNSCIIGISAFAKDLPKVSTIPNYITGLYLYWGERNLEILQEIITQGINEKLDYLFIGFVHDNKSFGYKDYTLITELLSKTSFPKLKSFEYGIDYLLAN